MKNSDNKTVPLAPDSHDAGRISWPLVGNVHITGFLGKVITAGDAGGTYIFAGPENLGKTTLAAYFSQVLLCQDRPAGAIEPCGICASCRRFSTRTDADSQMEIGETHADYHVIRKEQDKKNIAIDQVRDFIQTLSMSSFMNSYKIGIIKQAESLSDQAANALLKTLEEPREKVVLILITSEADVLPATIVSRAKILNFRPVKADIIYDFLVEGKQAARSQAKNFSRLALGRPALALKFLEDGDYYEAYRKQAETFLNFPGQDINARFAAIGELIDDKANNQENAARIMGILDIWQGLIRDILLINLGRGDLIQHHLFEERIANAGEKILRKNLFDLRKGLQQARENIAANVNVRLALENVATYF